MQIKFTIEEEKNLRNLYDQLVLLVNDDLNFFSELMKKNSLSKILFFDKNKQIENNKYLFKISIEKNFYLISKLLLDKGLFYSRDSFLIINSNLNYQQKADLLKIIWQKKPEEKKERTFRNDYFIDSGADNLIKHENILFYLFNNKKNSKQYYSLMKFCIDNDISIWLDDENDKKYRKNILHKIIFCIDENVFEDQYACIELALEQNLNIDYHKNSNIIDTIFHLSIKPEIIKQLLKLFKKNGLELDGIIFNLWQYCSIDWRYWEATSSDLDYFLNDLSDQKIVDYINKAEDLNNNGLVMEIKNALSNYLESRKIKEKIDKLLAINEENLVKKI